MEEKVKIRMIKTESDGSGANTGNKNRAKPDTFSDLMTLLSSNRQ